MCTPARKHAFGMFYILQGSDTRKMRKSNSVNWIDSNYPTKKSESNYGHFSFHPGITTPVTIYYNPALEPALSEVKRSGLEMELSNLSLDRSKN